MEARVKKSAGVKRTIAEEETRGGLTLNNTTPVQEKREGRVSVQSQSGKKCDIPSYGRMHARSSSQFANVLSNGHSATHGASH